MNQRNHNTANGVLFALKWGWIDIMFKCVGDYNDNMPMYDSGFYVRVA